MRAPVKQLAILAAAAATWAGAAGCEDSLGNDKQVRRDIVEAREAAAKGSSEEAIQKLTAAAGNTGASSAASAQAKASLGAAEVAEATRLMQVVDANNGDVARLVYEIGVLGNQIAHSNLKVDRYRGLEPTAARAEAKKRVDEVQGGGEQGNWIAAENANIPTLAAVKQNVSRLQGEIAKRQEEIKQLDQQRAAAAAEADKHREAAENATGDKRVELVKASAGAQKKASDLATQIEVVEAAIVPLQRDLAVAEAHQRGAQEAVASFNKQLEALDKGWKLVEQQIGTQAQIAANVLGAAGGAGGVGGSAVAPTTSGAEDDPVAAARTINEKAALLQQKIKDATDTFNAADTRLDNAITNYTAAVTAADQLNRDVATKREGVERNSPYYKAFDELLLIVNPATYKLGAAEANQLRATVNASQAISLLGRQRMVETLKPILEAAKLEVPEPLRGEELPAAVEAATAKANATYDAAAGLYQEVSSAPQEISAKNAAKVGRIFALYGKVMLARSTPGKEGEAAQFLQDAKEAQKLALESNAVLPAMPVELIVIPTTRPSTAPTTGPATLPTDVVAPAEATQPAEGTPPATEPGATPAPAEPVEPAAPTPADPAAPAPAP